MTFCYAPWTNIDISPTGEMTPCCKFQVEDNTYNIQTTSIAFYKKSEMVASAKEDFLNARWPKGCERCRIEEEHGIESKRELDYKRWGESYIPVDLDNPSFLTASLSFGNTCNLKCITCGPDASSLWREEYRQIYNIDIPHYKFYKESFVKDFVTQAPDVVHFDIVGGEPFISGVKEQQELLAHYVSSGHADKVTLHYTTNGTVFPDSTWWDLWSHFKEVDIQLSVDGIRERYEYIRYPAKWTDFDSAVDKYIAQEAALPNVRLSVSHTVSAYNIFYLDEFVQWCYTKGLPRPWLGRVHNPEHMRPTVWPEPVRTDIINKLLNSQDRDVVTWATLVANNDDSKLYETFRSKTKEHDAYRNTDFETVFPELGTL